MKTSIQFSIIIPTFNSEQYLAKCLDSIVQQTYQSTDFEVLVVDDFSTDETIKLARSYQDKLKNLCVIPLDNNKGPGAARNAGLDQAIGVWVLFVDSDDELLDEALSLLGQFISKTVATDVNAIGFDWTADSSYLNFNSSQRIGRRDSHFLTDRKLLIEQYLSHRMDGSTIYTAVRRQLLNKHEIRFDEGLHEDVDFIFKIYFFSLNILYFNQVLYKKNNHHGSIINSISKRHIEGYFRAWLSIKKFLISLQLRSEQLNHYMDSYGYGSIGTIATRIREVIRHCDDPALTSALLQSIYKESNKLLSEPYFEKHLSVCKTVYGQITTLFLATMSSKELTNEEKASLIVTKVKQMNKSSWSCIDLHHSLFLRPNEVRTCCKRFFVNGEMRGDVKLFDVEDNKQQTIAAETILTAKRELYQKINAGISCACDSCPFLEFKEWVPLNTLDIRYLSFEYHSICNLECTYCSEEYYGGLKAFYDIKNTIASLLDSDILDNCALAVWGGGEPIVGEGFDYLVNELAEKLPNLQQRILSNAVKKSTTVESLLINNKGQLVTSIDAGTSNTFEKIRGRNKLHQVCKNLQFYASGNAAKVTIKYIFTEGNTDLEEVKSFVELMKEHDLLRCTFQISGDFKQENIPTEVAMNMILLFGLLRNAECATVYFDELLWHRLTDLDIPKYIEKIHHIAGFSFIAKPDEYPSVVVWGAGQQAKYLLEKSNFFKQVNVEFFVDATPEKQGTVFYDREIKSPDTLKTTDLPVLIAAVQGYPLILEQYHNLGYQDSRLIQELII